MRASGQRTFEATFLALIAALSLAGCPATPSVPTPPVTESSPPPALHAESPSPPLAPPAGASEAAPSTPPGPPPPSPPVDKTPPAPSTPTSATTSHPESAAAIDRARRLLQTTKAKLAAGEQAAAFLDVRQAWNLVEGDLHPECQQLAGEIKGELDAIARQISAQGQSPPDRSQPLLLK